MNTTPRDNATKAELAEQFEGSVEPFAVWCSLDEVAGRGIWTVNDEDGVAVYETPSYKAAVKLSSALKAVDLGEEADNRRTGGLAAMLALLKMESIAEESDGEDKSIDEVMAYHYGQQARAIKAVTDAANEINPFLRGFIATLAEHVYFCMETGTPSLFHWKAEAAMTAGEIVLSRARMEESLREGDEVSHV